MAFVLRGEIDIDGRKGIATLRQVQGEAVKTTKAFEQGSRVNSHFAKMLLGINSQAAFTHKALLTLGRTSALALGGAVTIKTLMQVGEELSNIGFQTEDVGRSLDKAFKTGLKATTSEGVQSSIESITEQIKKLQQETEKFSLRRTIGKVAEKLTGTDFGLTPEEGLIAAGEKEIEILKKRLEARKALEEVLKTEAERVEGFNIEISKQEELRKLEIAQGGQLAKIYRQMGSEQINSAEKNLSNQEISLAMLKSQMEELKKIKGIEKDDPAIKKLSLEIRKQEVAVIKAQTQLIIAQRKEQLDVLGGSRAGRAALQSAQKRKGRQDVQEAFKREESAVSNRQLAENASRKALGLPEYNKADIRNMMAEEAVGLREIKPKTTLPSATGGAESQGGLKAEIKAVPMAQTMEDLLKEFRTLASVLQTAPLVTSGAGTA